ncbi:hypothetical protein [Dyella choica]|uniref:Uncharacterized protein n=1 Tax=Dyella choica TaxID=1927959 RepID=A0A432M120_9GAMM|nr:hypothetical protein [Dyella choica]RUL70513.1 hypothetical protein EKH80_20150 [Dyella choica]
MWCKFKVIGYLKLESLTVQPIAPPAPEGRVILFDVFVAEIALDLVPHALRMPNSEFWGLVEGSRTVVEVRAEIVKDLQWVALTG